MSYEKTRTQSGHPGPIVTTFEIKPDPGVHLQQIQKYADDICLTLKAESVHIDRMPGKPTIGVEVPNSQPEMINQDLVDAEPPEISDDFYRDAVRIVVTEGRASTSLLQRRLNIGYGRAAKLIDMMFHNNIVGPADGSRPREILVGLDYLDTLG